VNAIGSRKCRAAYIKVISGSGIGGTGTSFPNITYHKGATIQADKFDDDIRVSCTHGIHFFMTRTEAEEW